MIIAPRRPNYKLDRNQKIADLYFAPNSHHSLNSLAKIFNLSVARVSQIVNDWKRKMLVEGGEKC